METAWGDEMEDGEKFLSRRQINQRKKKHESYIINRLLNFLIAIVSILIIISLILIFTDANIKSNLKKNNEDTSEIVDDIATTEDNTSADGSGSAVNEPDQQSGQNVSLIDDSIEEQLQYITTVTSEDPNVIIAWVDARWTPYPTEQTGTHVNAFDVGHIDYQEKIKLIYRETGFTEETSILWNIKNEDGNAMAVISSKDRSNIFRLTLKWINNQGWQVIFVEQLADLQGAY